MRVEECEKPQQARSHREQRHNAKNKTRPPRAGKHVETRHRTRQIQEHKKQMDGQCVRSVRTHFVDALDERGEEIRADDHPEYADNPDYGFHRLWRSGLRVAGRLDGKDARRDYLKGLSRRLARASVLPILWWLGTRRTGCWYLKAQQIIFVTHRPPKSYRDCVVQQNINGKPLILWPNVRPQNLHCSTAKPSAATVAEDKKLPQIYLIWLFSIQSVGDNVSALLKNHTSILSRKKASHPLLKLRQRHKAVPMPFILEQLMIHPRQ